MKAVQMIAEGPPDVLRYVDVDMPVPGAGQVRVKAESISVNQFDAWVRSGTFPMKAPLPLILGQELCGPVDAVGQGVTSVTEGQRVVVFLDALKAPTGCYAEYVVADEADLIPVAEWVDLDEAAAFPLAYLTAFHCLHTLGHLQAGHTVLAYAPAGGVGMAVAQLARLVADVTTIGITRSEEKVAFARSQGYAHAFNNKTDDVVAKVKEVTAGHGADLILDSVAGAGFASNFDMLAPLGLIIWFGAAAGFPEVNITELMGANLAKGPGVRLFRIFNSIALPYPELFQRSKLEVAGLLGKGKIKPYIFQRLPLSDAAAAHALIEGGTTVGKIILKP